MMMLKRNVKYNTYVDHSCYRLKPTCGWVQSATSLIAIEGPVTLYHDLLGHPTKLSMNHHLVKGNKISFHFSVFTDLSYLYLMYPVRRCGVHVVVVPVKGDATTEIVPS